MSRNVRLVLFDAMHTLVRPAAPVGETYGTAFTRHGLGLFNSTQVENAFKLSIDRVKQNQPLLREADTTQWWQLVIRMTAVESGADSSRVAKVIPKLYEELVTAFRDRNAYEVYDDVKSTLKALKELNLRLGVVTNSDSRIRSVLQDVQIADYLDPIVVSQEEGIEKPDTGIWTRALERAGVDAASTLHVGDSEERDFNGALRAGLHALLLRRDNQEGLTTDEVSDLYGVVRWVKSA
ncbi:HAD hydrolase subfamily IA REG-2-like protein [Auriculariales sp. MPI-PUGE-AT-0066]|nr:HAD hydrolase subfamily IA REG-2-like protein [Auriculariales sp. MPI-PUGE-AT-0066]